MDLKIMESALKLVPKTYLDQGIDAKKTRDNKIAELIQKRKVPDDGWSDSDIEYFVNELTKMDSNNFPGNCGVGEREARIYSGIVYRRHFGAGHGIGRSGDISEVQPKAVGSSLMNKLTNAMILDIIKQSGVRSCTDCFVVPVATGMAMSLSLLSVRKQRPASAKYVLWSRIDQKSCFKAITTSGFEPIIIELKRRDDELSTDADAFENQIKTLGPDKIAAIVSTTSCFAPRVPDDIPKIAGLCHLYGIPHFVNNAYGIQSSKCMHLIEEAHKNGGRIDAFIQSADKNFMVPVGGAIIAGFQNNLIEEISKTYPGRGSSTPSMDLFITLLSMGSNGYKSLLSQRKNNFQFLKDELEKIATKHGERALSTKPNQISLAITLSTIDNGVDSKSVTDLGSKLFTRGVSGSRVITGKDSKNIDGYLFKGWGAHSNENIVSYLTAASGIGMEKEDVRLFAKRLDKILESKVKKS